MKTMVLVALLLPALATSLSAGWETVRHKGRDYVTVRSIKEFYSFKTMKKTGDLLELENAAVKMRLAIGGQEVFMNNIKFVFSFKIVPHQGRYLVSRIDLDKLLDPVLRPSYIPATTPFNTVIIDPGCGGTDSGAVNRFGEEKKFNLAVARLLKNDLEARRFKVVMTREADRSVSLKERVAFANGFKNAIFISIHFNSGGRGRAQGIETYTLSPAGVAHNGRGLRKADFKARKGNAQDSANIALATAVHGTCLLKTGRPDRGIRRARFTVLTGVKHPAVLFFGGFMSHSHEAKLIAEPTYQKALSRAIADAVVKYRLSTTRRLRKLPVPNP